MADSAAACFEQPLNERTRTFLRLEQLLARLRYHEQDDSAFGRHAAVTALIDVLTIMSRHNLRTEVSTALGSVHARLERLCEHEAVDGTQLQQILDRLDTLARELQRVPMQFAAQQLRDNGLLSSLDNRHAIPGGHCGFDLPAYQHWLSRSETKYRRDLEHWCRHIVPLENAVNALLQLLRDGTMPQAYKAPQGVLVHQADAGTQLIRVLVDNEATYPEISAGRHRATIRFMEYHDNHLNVRQCRHTVAFRMACCRL